MSFSNLQTPARPLPGSFLMTPGPPPKFPLKTTTTAPSMTTTPPNPAAPPAGILTTTTAPSSQVAAPPATHPQVSVIDRARKTIGEVLMRDAGFPDLDRYVRQGVSSDYDVPPGTETAWAPYEKTRMYDIPDRIFEQYNQAQVSTLMGLFAELNHAWISIDNALYLWDYTNPNPELIGFEEQDNTITAVKLVVPRKGVFVSEITHLLVVATTAEILLLGIAAASSSNGTSVTLYQTRMSLHLGGLSVRVIEGSRATGRIFFAGHEDNDVYELTYQQEEKWFASRCGKVNHTSKGYSYLVPTIVRKRLDEHVQDIVIDDTRKLVYTLSSTSSIRLFYMDSPATLQSVIEKRRQECLQDISHMGTQSPLLGDKMKIISISPISAKESQRIHLVATTSMGCRLFLSATRGYGYLGQGAPRSMQVQHVRFPPREPSDLASMGPARSLFNDDQPIITESRALQGTRQGIRYAPGYCLSFVTKDGREMDSLFLSAPDTGRIACMAREQPGQSLNFPEQGTWLELGSRAEDIGLVTKPFAAADVPQGFGNELAVQLDEPAAEIAILTNTGVHTIRRRRFIDIFAAAIRIQSGEEGLEGDVKRFIRRYGRGETIAAALAVACGQATDMSNGEARSARIMDPAILELARRVFIEQGGAPGLVDNAVVDGRIAPVDNVRPSARHEAIALYISRSVRAIWKANVIVQKEEAKKPVKITSAFSNDKLYAIQDNLIRLSEFLSTNRNFIEGLSGPDVLQRAGSRQEEIALQGEHQALHSLQKLIRSIIEGISFVSMLFDERVEDIWAALDADVRARLQSLTYESLFATAEGKELAKVLVKAIVNRNIANGSNVDTVAEALRRRCGSFCSAEDVLVFKAQEQLKKASEVGGSTDIGRNLLNESVRLLGQVAGSLSYENLHSAVEQFTRLDFYAGAIMLCLDVAEQSDKGHRALSWLNDGKPEPDSRSAAFESRKKCYDLIHHVLLAVDDATSRIGHGNDHHLSLMETKRLEAYGIVNDSRDEVFHYDLYDWYLEQGWTDRLLGSDSEFVVSYLQRLSTAHLDHADLLWRYYANKEQYLDAANVQLQLAKSDFPIRLANRIEYLSRAKANAAANATGIGRQARQVLHHEVTELLEVANIQDDILQRLKSDTRLAPERKPEVITALDGQIIGLTELYNSYADQADYYDICLLIYQAADHRNPADVMATWQNLLDSIEASIDSQGDQATELPYEEVITKFRALASRLNLSETIFPPNILIPLVEKWAFEKQRDIGSRTWVVDMFLEIGVPPESVITSLEAMIYADEVPFRGQNKNILAYHMYYTIKTWFDSCVRNNLRLFGGDSNYIAVIQKLVALTHNGLTQEESLAAHDLRRSIERAARG